MKGVGPRRAEQLARLGISTVEDLLYHIPFRYQDRREIKKIRDLTLGEEEATVGQLARMGRRFMARSRRWVISRVSRRNATLARWASTSDWLASTLV